MKLVATSLALATTASTAAAHGAFTNPTARNYIRLKENGQPGFANFGAADFQSGNGNTQNPPFANMNHYKQGSSGLPASPCGDVGAYSSNQDAEGNKGWFFRGNSDHEIPKSYEAWLKQPELVGRFEKGGELEVQMTITAYHGGKLALYLCPWEEGAPDFDPEACGLFKNTPNGDDQVGDYNTNSSFYLGQFELPSNFDLCDNCKCPAGGCPACETDNWPGTQQDRCTKSGLGATGAKWAWDWDPAKDSANGDDAQGAMRPCGYKTKIDHSGMDLPTGAGVPAGCGGKTNDATSSIKIPSEMFLNDDGSKQLLKVPKELTTEKAVLVWHWITNNQAGTTTDHEQFMNCADMSSNPNLPPAVTPIPAGKGCQGPPEFMPWCSKAVTAKDCANVPAAYNCHWVAPDGDEGAWEVAKASSEETKLAAAVRARLDAIQYA